MQACLADSKPMVMGRRSSALKLLELGKLEFGQDPETQAHSTRSKNFSSGIHTYDSPELPEGTSKPLHSWSHLNALPRKHVCKMNISK